MSRPPKVPKVNLADPNVEPTDEELAALMNAMRHRVVEKSRATEAEAERKLDQMLAQRSSARSGRSARPPRPGVLDCGNR